MLHRVLTTDLRKIMLTGVATDAARVTFRTPVTRIRRTLHGRCRIVMPVGSSNGSGCNQGSQMRCRTWIKAVGSDTDTGAGRAVHWLPVDQRGWHGDKERGREWESERECERCSLSGDIYVYTNIVSFLICVTRCVFFFPSFFLLLLSSLLTDSTKTARTVVPYLVCSEWNRLTPSNDGRKLLI